MYYKHPWKACNKVYKKAKVTTVKTYPTVTKETFFLGMKSSVSYIDRVSIVVLIHF